MDSSSSSLSPPSTEAFHRRPPPPDILGPDNFYVGLIQHIRENTREFVGLDGGKHGPISHALQTIRGFACSASGWTEDHLARFQVLVLPGQVAGAMFPREYALSAHDKTLQTIQTEGFFSATKSDIAHGTWPPKMYSNFFIDLMHLLRGGNRTPTPHNSPKKREAYIKAAKRDANEAVKAALAASRSWSSSNVGSDTVFSPGTALSTESSSVVNLGNRETSTYSLMHNFLKYIAIMEHRTWPESPLWCPR